VLGVEVEHMMYRSPSRDALLGVSLTVTGVILGAKYEFHTATTSPAFIVTDAEPPGAKVLAASEYWTWKLGLDG
jgi:hypothetical protein